MIIIHMPGMGFYAIVQEIVLLYKIHESFQLMVNLMKLIVVS